MDVEALRQAVEHAGLAAAGIGFLAGFLFSFNPVALASIPVSLAYVTRGRDKNQALLFGTMFILGMILTHVVLGLIAGLGGKWVAEVAGRGWGLFLGPLLIVLGLLWAGWLPIPLPSFGFRATRPTAAWGAFLLGIPFAIAVCPVCTPAFYLA
jgi:cytochrome c-type biogenesis protein